MSSFSVVQHALPRKYGVSASFLVALSSFAILALAAPLAVASSAPAASAAATVVASQSYVVSAEAVTREIVRDGYGVRQPPPVRLTVRERAQRALNRLGASGYTLVIDASWSGGHYGRTDLKTKTISIQTRTPSALIESVTIHEYAHILQAKAAGEDWRRVNEIYGQSSGVEAWADCYALAHGATWIGYGCNGSY